MKVTVLLQSAGGPLLANDFCLVIQASANAANSWAPSQVRVGGQNQKGGSEMTDEATSAVAALQMSVVHQANIRTILN